MKNWMRVVLPPSIWVAGFLFTYLLVMGASWMIYSASPFQGNIFQLLFPYRDALVLATAFSYGVFRGYRFHPICQADYLDYLKQTAWTPQKPLPLGPVHMAWQDVIVLLIFSVAIWPAPFYHPLAPFFTMTMGYLLASITVFQLCHLWKHLYVIAFGCSTAFLFWSQPAVSIPLLILLSVIAWQGIKESLEKLHRKILEETISGSESFNYRLKFFEQYSIKRLTGWPFDSLISRKPTFFFMKEEITSVPRIHGMLVSLLVGWSIFAAALIMFQGAEIEGDNWIEQLSSDSTTSMMYLTQRTPTAIEIIQREYLYPGQSMVSQEAQPVLMVLSLPSFFLFILRLTYYCDGYYPPINLWGRLRTFRWIIPKYDKVFISPISILLIPALLIPASIYIGLSSLFTGPLIVTLMFLAALLIGPKRVEWQLTAPCRLVRPAKYRQSDTDGFIEL